MPASVTEMPYRFKDGTIGYPTPALIARSNQRKRELGLPTTEHRDDATHRQFARTAQRNTEAYKAAAQQIYATAELTTEIYQRILLFAPVALKVLEDIISGELPAPIALRAKYASLHLGRAGFPSITKVDAAHFNQHLTSADVELIKQRASLATQESSSELKEQ